MLYTIQNEYVTVKISDRGAEPVSAKAADGTEYLWQADSRYWGRTAPWLFPICSGLPQGEYTYRGKTYKMEKHGFARNKIFSVQEASPAALTMVLVADAETKEIYPFDFFLSVAYRLEGNRLSCTLTVKNNGKEMMPATVGGHPGFAVPFAGDSDFSDWRLEFSAPCTPRAVVFTEDFMDSGARAPLALANNTCLPLSHDLFLVDGIFLCDMASGVTLCSDKSPRAVTVEYGDAPYLGIWSSANGGPFVCIEPWYGMASPVGVTDIEKKTDMFHLGAGESKTVTMDMVFH